MSSKIKSLLGLALAAFLTSIAQASPKMDANGDEQISRIEYMSFKSNAFNKQDKNFDGRLTKQEISEARKELSRQSAKKRFQSMDLNGDGNITQQEHDETANAKNIKFSESTAKKADRLFNNMDSDKNGHISRLEFDSFQKTAVQNRQSKNLKSTQKQFQTMDLDKDGLITEFEYVDKGRSPYSKPSKKSDPLKGLYKLENTKPKKRTRRDGNSDGDVTKREDREYHEYQFNRMDKNKDDIITKKEAKYLFQDYVSIGY